MFYNGQRGRDFGRKNGRGTKVSKKQTRRNALKKSRRFGRGNVLINYVTCAYYIKTDVTKRDSCVCVYICVRVWVLRRRLQLGLQTCSDIYIYIRRKRRNVAASPLANIRILGNIRPSVRSRRRRRTIIPVPRKTDRRGDEKPGRLVRKGVYLPFSLRDFRARLLDYSRTRFRRSVGVRLPVTNCCNLSGSRIFRRAVVLRCQRFVTVLR